MINLPEEVLGEAELDHVAIGTQSIRSQLPFYQGVLGGEFVTGGDNPVMGYRAVQFVFKNGMKVELLEPLEGSSFLDSFLKAKRGVHHLTFRVPDLLAVQRVLSAKGYRLLPSETVNGELEEIFIHPSSADGVLVQLVRHTGRPGEQASTNLEEVLSGQGFRGNGTPSPAGV